jgi:hydroxymethylglutaryl-CoA lyase
MLKPNNYILIPNSKKLETVIRKSYLKNFSFITSVSNNFQEKNTKKNLDETRKDIFNMILMLENERKDKYKIKLYISCINECPIEGKLSKQHIVKHLIPLFSIGVDKICLSDTCGTLDHIEFDEIIKELLVNNISLHKIGLHLHVKDEEIVEKIIHKALDYGIMDFDVSILKSGGCSVTMNRESICPNLSYDLYYKSLVNYIIENSKTD